MDYDSKADTLQHIKQVQKFINRFIVILLSRAEDHDFSKLNAPEKDIFDKYTPKLKDTTYGSDQYKSYLKEMNVALDHHYQQNRHHPEHFVNGVSDMNLVDIIEMVCDWKAATMRHSNGDIFKSLEINSERFGLNEQLVKIIHNTLRDFEW